MMKKRHLTFLISLVLSFSISNAQEKSDLEILNFKLFVNFSYHYAQGNVYGDFSFESYESLYREESLDIGGISLGLEISHREKLTHELELMPFNFEQKDELFYLSFNPPVESRVIRGGKSIIIESAFRYQINYYLIKEKLINPYLALSSQLFYNYSKFKPATTNFYPAKNQNFGMLFSFIPGFTIPVSENFLIDINIPFGIYDIRFHKSKNDNPRIPVEYLETSEFVGVFIPNQFNARVGIIYCFK